MNKNQQKSIKDENISPSKPFTSGSFSPKFCNVLAKSKTEPRNSNHLSVANSTPQACFFIRSIHTPKERLEALSGSERLSMVACSGKGFALCCIPLIAVFEPVIRYRPNPRKFSDSLLNHSVELSTMIYLFKAVSRVDLRNTSKPLSALPNYILRIQADTLEQAKAKVCPLFAVKGGMYA